MEDICPICDTPQHKTTNVRWYVGLDRLFYLYANGVFVRCWTPDEMCQVLWDAYNREAALKQGA